MSDTVKIIIEIPKAPKNDHERWVLAHGIPLDDVKALIEYNAEIHEDGDSYLMEQWVYDILDGKYNADIPQAKRYRQEK